jgi:hypothetical protein
MMEVDIHARVAAAKLRLRFDKVAQRLIRDLQSGFAAIPSDNETLLITVTAPIRRCSDTVAQLIAAGSIGNISVNGNSVQMRLVRGGRPRVLVFVHNPESDPTVICDIAESRLREAP